MDGGINMEKCKTIRVTETTHKELKLFCVENDFKTLSDGIKFLVEDWKRD